METLPRGVEGAAQTLFGFARLVLHEVPTGRQLGFQRLK